MAKRKQAQASNKKQAKKRSKAMPSERTAPDNAGEQQATIQDNLITGGDLRLVQAKLIDRRLPVQERRALAAKIGSLHGNRHLQRLLAAAPNIGDIAQVRTQPHPGSESVQRAGELEGTKEVSEDEQKKINETLNPNITSSGKSKDLIAKDFDTNMIAALDAYVTKAAAHAKKQLDPKSPKLDMGHVRKIATESQSAVSKKFSGYVKGASMSPENRRHQVNYDLSSSKNLKPYSSMSIKDGDLRNLTHYLMTVSYVGGPVVKDHHVDLSRDDDKKLFKKVLEAYFKAHKGELRDIQATWPGEMDPNLLRVFIQTNLSSDKGMGDDEVVRRGYWSTYQTLIHEYIHVLEHPLLADMAYAQSSTGYQILTEGFCDYFAVQVWEEIKPKIAGDADLRKRIESGTYKYNPKLVPDWDSYPEIKEAKEIGAKVGEPNMRAAFFMGHTELLGGGSWSKEDEANRDTYTVPAGGRKVSQIAKQTNVPAADIASLNGLAEDARAPAGKRLKVQGIKYHHVIDYDVGVRIAKQHNISFTELNRANPGVNWRKLRRGKRLLIPKH